MLYSHPISTPLGVTVAGNGNHGGSGEVMRFGGSAHRTDCAVVMSTPRGYGMSRAHW